MASKKGVVLYYEILEQLEDLTDEQFGKVARAIIKYDKTGEIPEFDDPTIKISFKCIKPNLDRNKQEYESKCEMQRQKIQDYWDKKKQEELLNTIEYNRIQKNTDKDNDKDKDIINNNKNNLVFACDVVRQIENKQLRDVLNEYLRMRNEIRNPMIAAIRMEHFLKELNKITVDQQEQIEIIKNLIGQKSDKEKFE